MHNRILGNNHLTVSSIGLGCWGMSHAYGKADEKESLATIEKCPGMKQRKHIDENLAAVKLPIPSEVIKTLTNMDMDVYGNRHNTYNLQFVDTES